MKTAKIISIIGHPIFHPTWMMILLLLTGITQFNHNNDLTFLSTTFAMTFFVPVVIIVMMKKWGIIQSFEMEERDDRLGPLFIMILFLYTTLQFFNKIHLFQSFSFYLITVIAVTALAFIVTFFWKISLHTLGWGNMVGYLFIKTIEKPSFLPYLIAGILLTGIVAAARLKLKSHSNTQIYSGFAMGFATVMVMFFLMS